MQILIDGIVIIYWTMTFVSFIYIYKNKHKLLSKFKRQNFE